METLKTKSLAWHYFSKPSRTELTWLGDHLKLPPLVLDELASPLMRPKVESFDGYIYIVLHFPIFDPKERKTYSREVDFILTKHEMISVTYHTIPPLEDAFRKCSSEKSSQELYASRTPGHLFHFVIKELYDFALRELDHIQENINRLEEAVFSTERQEESVIEDLSFVRRDIIGFRRSVKPQQVTLEALAIQAVEFYGPSVQPFFQAIIGEYQKVWNLLENNKEAVDALYDNNVTILNIKQNEAMRILSILAFVTFPLVLFAQLFSMSTQSTPIIGSDYDFWIIVGIMVAAALGMFIYFKRKKWL